MTKYNSGYFGTGGVEPNPSNSKSEDTNFYLCCMCHGIQKEHCDSCKELCKPPQDTSLDEYDLEIPDDIEQLCNYLFEQVQSYRTVEGWDGMFKIKSRVLAWHKVEVANLLQVIEDELLDYFTVGAPSYKTANEAVKAQAKQHVEGVMSVLKKLKDNVINGGSL